MAKIIKVKNVLKNKERKKLIKDCQPFLTDGEELGKMFPGSQYPGKQTTANLHEYPQFVDVCQYILSLSIKKLKIKKLHLIKSWINCLDGKNTAMHNHHPHDYSIVYYIKTFPLLNSGTFFKDYGLVRCPQNGLIIFPSYLYHSNPSYPFGLNRYTLAMDLKVD